jgi:hypothetical protein
VLSVQADDSYWRRPPDGYAGEPPEPTSPEHPTTSPAEQPYQPPPPMLAPPAHWRPGYLVEGPPARRLPDQDHARIDAEEARARVVTQVVAGIAGAGLLLLMCWLCGSAMF